MARLACADLTSTRWMLNKDAQNPCSSFPPSCSPPPCVRQAHICIRTGQVIQRILQVCSPTSSVPFLNLDFQCPILPSSSNATLSSTTSTTNTTSITATSTTVNSDESTSLSPPARSCCCSSITF